MTPTTTEKQDPILEVENLVVRFHLRDGTLNAVQDVSFNLYPGESLGVVGESGCGKSVTFLSTMRLIPRPPGEIKANALRFSGTEILQASRKEMRQIRGNKISMVFQDPMTSLNPVLTVGKQMEEILELHMGYRGKVLQNRCVELLHMVGISEPHIRLKSYPHQLSGGLRQRVMIAIALSCTPQILLADEPTTALDVTIQDQILRLIRNLTRDMGTATVLITHNLGAVAGTTDRIMVMYAGKIVEMASTAALFERPLHPYTQGLLRSIPRIDQVSGERLYSINGAPPDPLREFIQGCDFSPRCPQADDHCHQHAPTIEPMGDDHFVSCWKAQDASK